MNLNSRFNENLIRDIEHLKRQMETCICKKKSLEMSPIKNDSNNNIFIMVSYIRSI